MTVEELIKELEKVEDKSKEVIFEPDMADINVVHETDESVHIW